MQTSRDILKNISGGKSVALFGRGVSTIAAQSLFKTAGVNCVFYGDKDGENFGEAESKNHALAVYSPAFSPRHPFRILAEKCGVKAVGEPDLAGMIWRGKTIAVSGTNGKTTLTSFLTAALNKAGKKAFACGNIGRPLCAFLADGVSADETAVFEISSFQSTSLKSLNFDAFLWTNFAPDHLDWHADMREYFDAKLNILNFLKSETFIYGSGVKEFAQKFSRRLPDFAVFADKNSAFESPKPFDNSIQRENFLIAKLFWKSLNLDEKILLDSAKDFSLARYRFAKISGLNGITFWNDSKATNAHAAIAALKELKGKKVFWIGGGKNKYCDNSELCKTVGEVACGAALIGQTAGELKNALKGLPLGVYVCENLKQAIELAVQKCPSKADILFSPAFSSFGMFKSYSDRGKCFDEAVSEILSEKNIKIQLNKAAF